MNADQLKYRGLVVETARRFHAKFGGSLPDLIQSAWVFFLEAEKTYDPRRGAAFQTWAIYQISRRLWKERRREIRKYRDYEYRAPVNSEFRPGDFLDALPGEVAEIIRIFWERENPGGEKHRWEHRQSFFRLCRRRGVDPAAAAGEIAAALV